MSTRCLGLTLFSTLLAGCPTQVSRGPAVRDLEPRPVAAADDPVNALAAYNTDGLVLTLTIDSATVHLDSVVLAQIPQSATKRRTRLRGDQVTVVGFADGTRISEASAPDGTLNVQEGTGLVRMTRRQVVVSLPAPRALDTVQVVAPATGAKAQLDVRSAYAMYCKEYRQDNRYCPRRRPN